MLAADLSMCIWFIYHCIYLSYCSAAVHDSCRRTIVAVSYTLSSDCSNVILVHTGTHLQTKPVASLLKDAIVIRRSSRRLA